MISHLYLEFFPLRGNFRSAFRKEPELKPILTPHSYIPTPTGRDMVQKEHYNIQNSGRLSRERGGITYTTEFIFSSIMNARASCLVTAGSVVLKHHHHLPSFEKLYCLKLVQKYSTSLLRVLS